MSNRPRPAYSAHSPQGLCTTGSSVLHLPSLPQRKSRRLEGAKGMCKERRVWSVFVTHRALPCVHREQLPRPPTMMPRILQPGKKYMNPLPPSHSLLLLSLGTTYLPCWCRRQPLVSPGVEMARENSVLRAGCWGFSVPDKIKCGAREEGGLEFCRTA